MQLYNYICNVRISTSYHNKAICRRSMYLRPRLGEGFLYYKPCKIIYYIKPPQAN